MRIPEMVSGGNKKPSAMGENPDLYFGRGRYGQKRRWQQGETTRRSAAMTSGADNGSDMRGGHPGRLVTPPVGPGRTRPLRRGEPSPEAEADSAEAIPLPDVPGYELLAELG